MQVAEPLHVGGITIEAVDYRSLTDDQLRLLNEFENVVREEVAPENPVIPISITKAEVRTMPDYFVIRQFWGLDDEGRLAAQAFTWWTTTEDNRHAASVGIEVRPDVRRRGIGKTLLGLLVDALVADDRSLMIGTSIDRAPAGQAFAERVGAQLGLATHINRLEIAHVDRDLMSRWVKDGPERAPDYELMYMDGAYPEEQLEAIVDLANVMNTAPRDDLDLEDRTITAEHMRAWEVSLEASKSERWALFARQSSSGDLVGYTEVRWNPAQPNTVWQGDTAVRPEHRGHALGKWLKAKMLERILVDRPNVQDIRTGNADSNAPMLGINHAMGFQPYIAHLGWQVSVERARGYLDGSSV